MSTPRLPWDDESPPTAAVASAPRQQSPAHTAPVASVPFCIHGSAATRLAAARRHVLEHMPGSVRVLGATHDQADDVVRHVLADRRATLGVARAGWVGYSVRLATPALMSRGLTPISGLGLEAVVARAVARARQEGALSYFAAASRHPGFVRSLTRTVMDLRLAGVAPTCLSAATGKSRDLAYLAGAIDAALQSLGHADRAQVLALALEAVTDGGGTEGLSDPLVLVDPPLSSRRDVDLAAALLARSTSALVTAPEGDTWAMRLRHAVPVAPAHHREADLTGGTAPALQRVQADLFAATALREAVHVGDPSVECISAPGEGRECVELARAVLARAEAGTRFDRMAIVLRAPELYGSHLETALRRAGVPAYFARGTRRPDPAGRAFLALLTCAAEHLSARRFAEYLSLGQVPCPGVSSAAGVPPVPGGASDGDQQGLWQPPVDEGLGLQTRTAPSASPASMSAPHVSAASPWRWEGILNDAQVIGGAERWERRLRGYREQLQVRADAARADDLDSPRHQSLVRRMEWADELIAFAAGVVGEMAAWPSHDDWGAWLERLERLAPRVLVRPDRVLSTLTELRPLTGVSGVSLPEVCDVLRERLTHLPVPLPDSRYGRVFVGTPDQVRGRLFEYVCVPGLAERVFPQRSRQDPLLLDAERVAISPDLPVDDDRVAAERLQLRLAAGAASEGLLVSYASMETSQARPRVPSFYAMDVQRAVTGAVAGYQALIRDAQQRSGARLAWPAPQDPALAIDDAEHDLSMLQGYLRGPETDIAGRARYLFDLNPALRRALLARHFRLKRTWTAHDGLLAAGDALARHRLAARAYSASALQRFAVCPYQFYLSTILRLEPREEALPLTTLDPLTRGSMVHEMLAEIMRTCIARGWTPPPAGSEHEAHATADEVVTRVAELYADRLLPPIVRVWEDAVAAMRRDIHQWLARLSTQDSDWTPAFVEMGVGFAGGFGRDDASRREEAVLPDGTRLHGVVDLIERRDPDQWRITDYKTGKYRLADRIEVNGGRTLQPILYAMAVEAVLGGRVTSSRLSYCTADGDYTEREWPVSGASGDATRARGLEVLAVIDRAIAQGHLPAAPDDNACTYCDFRAICGPGAQQVPQRKDMRSLDELLELRRWR